MTTMPYIVWQNWHTGSNTVTSGSLTDEPIFQSWCEQTSATTTVATTSNLWGTWVTVREEYHGEYEVPADRVAKQIEVMRRHAELQKKQQERAERERLARKVEAERAEALLLASLSPEQRAEWEQSKKITVVGGHTENRYEIVKGRAHNIFRLTAEGKRAVEFCVHVEDAVPDDDNVLSQKLMLEYAEEELLKIANSRVVAH